MANPVSTKYAPLAEHLSAQYGNSIRMTFADIERVLGFALPPSARRHRPWWSNNPDNSAMTRVWLDAGFRTEQVDIPGETLVFARVVVGAGEPQREFRERPQEAIVASVESLKRHPAIGAMKGMITIMPGVDITAPVDPDWIERLEREDATAGDLVGGLDDPIPGRG
ncbi:MAG: hypothetical protein AB7O56_09755 [Bauldia sp.]